MADAATAGALPPVEETLAWESTYRSRTALATIVGGNLILIGGVLLGVVLNGVPRVGLLDGLRAATGQRLSNGTGLRTDALRFYDGRLGSLVLAYVLQAVGALATAATLGYLFRATKARRAEMPRAALYGALIGPIVLGVSLLVLGIGFAVGVHNFVSAGHFDTKSAHDALNGGLLVAAPVLHTSAGLAVAFAFVLVSVNAMRVGLLTRFMGVLGMIVGALFVFPIGSSFVVQGFWMIAFGFMLMGRWPGGPPPAWSTGKPVPWPTQQELREQRKAAQAGDKPELAPRTPVPVIADKPAKTKDAQHPSSKKRKRKRR